MTVCAIGQGPAVGLFQHLAVSTLEIPCLAEATYLYKECYSHGKE